MTLSFNCPACGQAVEIEDEHVGWTVRCPLCRHEFVARAAGSHANYPVEEGSAPPSSPVPRPRRRRRRPRYDDEEVDVEWAKRRVADPARWLEIVGWLSIVMTVLLSGFFIVVGLIGQNQPAQQQRMQQQDNDPIVFFVMAGCMGIFGIPYFAVMAYGARKLRNLSSWGWAMASTVMAIASIILFGLCSTPAIAVGIWALTRMLDPEVKAAFEEVARERFPNRYVAEDEYPLEDR